MNDDDEKKLDEAIKAKEAILEKVGIKAKETTFAEWIDQPRAFIRVYRLPNRLTDGYCHGGGVPITFVNVDWFEHVLDDVNGLRAFIVCKRYFRHDASFLVLSEHAPYVFTMGKPIKGLY